ncbi:ABC transporter ATP-binding protein/permease [Treponema primitia]|uniref:ABC transporter ATP-binding protein n=1 Tax=Treponema primitia TaxID=88058 RepID=UPI0039811268
MLKELLFTIGRKGKRMLCAAIIAYTSGSLLTVSIMVVVFQMLTKITEGEKNLIVFWWMLAGILLLKFIANIVSSGASHFAGFEMELHLKERIIKALKGFSLGFYTNERLGEISTIVHGDVDGLEEAVAHVGSRAIGDIITALVTGVALFILDWKMGIVMIFLLPLALYLQAKRAKKSLQLRGHNQKNLADMVSRFVEYTKGIPLLKTFPDNRYFRDQLKLSAERFSESSKAEAKSGAVSSAVYFIPLELCFGFVVLIGAFMVWKKLLDIDSYVYFIVFSQEFYKPFANLEMYRMNYTKIKDNYGRIAWILKTPVILPPTNPRSPEKFDIRFDHVGFRYDTDGFELQDIDFTLEQNTLTALVGPSGSGKTTISNLLLRFWETHSGIIKIGGIDIRDIEYDELLSKISIVMQNVILFSDTIYDNIKMGNRNASRETVIEAAKKAMIHDFIISLPDGYDTLLGENGAGLSGGQKQRISIARAFIKNSPIVLLDEVTSNVDPINEVSIQSAISNLVQNRTVLVIAHHLRTVQTADTIIVFNAGRVTEMGKHEELLQNKGLYHELWTAQEQAKKWSVEK